jgi:hypothetical protein
LKPIGVGFHVPSLGWSCHFQEVGHSSGKWQMKDNGVCSSKNISPKAMFTSAGQIHHPVPKCSLSGYC